MKNFVTSDFHLNHANIIRYCNRPFKDVETMNNTIIHNFNEVIKEDDIVYHNGDYCFCNTSGGKKGEGEGVKASELIKKFNGNWTFLKGNHDRNNSLRSKLVSCVIDFGHQPMFMTHRPQNANPDYPINLVGHVHDAWKMKEVEINGKTTVLINVGVDVWNFRPVSLDKIVTSYNQFMREKECLDQKTLLK